MNKKSLRIVLPGFVILAALGGIAAFQYTQYRDVAARVPENTTPMRINILNPASGFQSPRGAPVLININASALGPSPPLALELWANGRLVGLQAGPSGGISPLSGRFAWIPTATGYYALIARARDNEKRTATSDAMGVLITASTKPDQARETQTASIQPVFTNGTGGEELGSVHETATAPLPEPPAQPDPHDSIGPAEPWDGDPLDWLSQLLVRTLPAAPELTAVPNGCGATLRIHDLSTNEDGFFVYRQLPHVPGWKRIATLSSQSKTKWLTFEDKGYSGVITYYVASFNNRREAPGNLAAVQVNPADCPTVSPEVPIVSVALADLKTDRPADHVYCYQSLGGVHWTRVPASGFFLPKANGFDTKNLTHNVLLSRADSPSNADSRALPTPELSNRGSSLDVECWGWRANVLQLLGKVHRDGLNLQTPGDVSLTNAGLSATYTVNRSPVIKPLRGSGDGPQPPIEAFDSRMPGVMAFPTTNVEYCKDHLASKGQDLLEAILFCTPYPEYAPNPQPYMFWWAFDGLCANGKADNGANCKSVDWYRQRAVTYGGSLGYQLRYEYVDGPYEGLGTESVAVTPYNRTVYVIPPLEPYGSQADVSNLCGVKTKYEVQLFYDAGPSDPLYANMRLVSPQLGYAYFRFDCVSPPSQVAVDVTIDTLELDNVDDDDGGVEDVELYGSFQVNTSSMATSPSWGIRNLATWASLPEGCPNELFTGGLETNATGECPESFTSKMHNFKDLRLCASESYQYCGFGFDDTTYLAQNNTIRIVVKEGDAIIMHTTLIDYDAASSDDNICVGSISTANKSLDTWSKIDGVWTMVYSNPGHASCKMHFRLKAVKP